MHIDYAPQGRAERLIAGGRIVLAAWSLLAVWLDPAEPARYAGLTYGLLVAYVLYAVVLGAWTWRSRLPSGSRWLVSHVLDLVVFTLLMYLTEGPVSPLFAFFVFSIVCATLRWHWRGTLWTAGAALGAYLGLGAYAGLIAGDPAFELNRFLIRAAYLVVIAALLGHLGAYERRARADLARLAAWPAPVARDAPALLAETLAHVAAIAAAPRVVLVWDDPEEPWTHLASWSRADGLRWTREPPGAFEPPVSLPVAGAAFLCADAGADRPAVLYRTPQGLARWTGAPVHPGLGQRFRIGAVLGCRVQGELVKGWLLVLDRPGMISDDLLLGEVVAREVVARLEHGAGLERVRALAETEARISLARDLHDGLMQSLAAAALQIESARALVATDPAAASDRLHEVQRLLGAEQRDLRTLLRDLKPLGPDAAPPEVTLPTRLQELRARVERQWNLRVSVEADESLTRLPRDVARDVHLIVQEAVLNAARHGRPSAVTVQATALDGRVRIVVADDGRGFRFRGRRDHSSLAGDGGGPASLWSRVDALGGALTIDSGERGARLEIDLPSGRAGRGRAG